jgi:hypothetical protein
VRGVGMEPHEDRDTVHGLFLQGGGDSLSGRHK